MESTLEGHCPECGEDIPDSTLRHLPGASLGDQISSQVHGTIQDAFREAGMGSSSVHATHSTWSSVSQSHQSRMGDLKHARQEAFRRSQQVRIEARRKSEDSIREAQEQAEAQLKKTFEQVRSYSHSDERARQKERRQETLASQAAQREHFRKVVLQLWGLPGGRFSPAALVAMVALTAVGLVGAPLLGAPMFMGLLPVIMLVTGWVVTLPLAHDAKTEEDQETITSKTPREAAPQKSRRAQKRELARAEAERLESARVRARRVTTEYAEYLFDACAVVRRPALHDLEVPQTQRFVQAYNDLSGMDWEKNVSDVERFERLVSEAEIAWSAASQHATRVGASYFSLEEQKRLTQAEQLLRMALSEGSTVPERKLAYERALGLLQGLVVLHEQAILQITSRAGLAITSAPDVLGSLATDDPAGSSAREHLA